MAAPGARTSVAAMLTVVAKLTLKTLVEEVRLGSEDRVGLLLLKLCEAFPEMMDGGKKCFSCVLFYAVAAAAA